MYWSCGIPPFPRRVLPPAETRPPTFADSLSNVASLGSCSRQLLHVLLVCQTRRSRVFVEVESLTWTLLDSSRSHLFAVSKAGHLWHSGLATGAVSGPMQRVDGQCRCRLPTSHRPWPTPAAVCRRQGACQATARSARSRSRFSRSSGLRRSHATAVRIRSRSIIPRSRRSAIRATTSDHSVSTPYG